MKSSEKLPVADSRNNTAPHIRSAFAGAAALAALGGLVYILHENHQAFDQDVQLVIQKREPLISQKKNDNSTAAPSLREFADSLKLFEFFLFANEGFRDIGIENSLLKMQPEDSAGNKMGAPYTFNLVTKELCRNNEGMQGCLIPTDDQWDELRPVVCGTGKSLREKIPGLEAVC